MKKTLKVKLNVQRSNFERFVIVCVFIIIAIWITGISFFLFGKIHHNMMVNRSPHTQLNTTWQSEDGSIVFHVENYTPIGTMIVNGEILDIYIRFNIKGGEGADIFPVSALDDELAYPDEKWETCSCSYKSKKKFVLTVKEGTYLKEGQEITFYRVDENGTPSE